DRGDVTAVGGHQAGPSVGWGGGATLRQATCSSAPGPACGFLRRVRRWRDGRAGGREEEAAMKALTVRPGRAGSLEVTDVPEPDPELGEILVAGLALGVCGTDREIVAA